MYYPCKVTGMDISKGYRHLGSNLQSIRDCVQILNVYGGFVKYADIATPGWSSNLFGKLVPSYDRHPKEYYDCLVKNDRLNGQKIRQSNQKMLQLTRRVLQLEKL